MNCSTVNTHFQHGNSASPSLYIGYLNSLLRFYVCRWQRRGEGWHLQRNRESWLAAFSARIAVRLLISHPQSSLVVCTTALRSPAIGLTPWTTLSLQSPRYAAAAGRRCCVAMEGASAAAAVRSPSPANPVHLLPLLSFLLLSLSPSTS